MITLIARKIASSQKGTQQLVFKTQVRTNKKNHIIFFETFITYPVCVFVKKASWNKSQLTIHVRMIETICALKERVNYQNFHHTTSQVFLQNMVIFVKTLVFFYNPAKKQFNADKRLI